MAATKVLVVDDSFAMRTLISGVLESIPNVEVVGQADGADEAREMVAKLRPHVMTLDVEMPGMSGLQYLAEIMEKRPMPVIMFSTRTTAGAADSIEALRLGAVDCFPKPRAAASEFEAMIVKLGKRIKATKGVELRTRRPANDAAPRGCPPIDWNGRLLVVGGDASSTAIMFEMFGAFPANCPPTLVVQHLGPNLLDSMVAKLNQTIAPRVVVAQDGMAVEQGTIYFAPAGDKHLVVSSWPAATLRLLAADPVAGERPSISLLFASAAKAAAANAMGLLLMDRNEDGGGGMKALLGGGAYALAAADKGGFELRKGMAAQPVTRDELAGNVLKLCSK